MKILDNSVEANIQIFNYSSTEEFPYKTLQALPSFEGRVDFSVLIDIKQTGEVQDKSAEVILMHIFDPEIEDHEDGRQASQRFRSISLGEIDLFGFQEDSPQREIKDPSEPLLLADPWKIKQTAKWNFKGVRSDGPGKYAVALVVYMDEESEESENRNFLDCDYFEIT